MARRAANRRQWQLPKVRGQEWGHQGREATERLGGWVWASESAPGPVHQEEKQAGVLGLNTSWEHVSTEVRDYVRRQEAQLEWVLRLLHVLLSCTFLLVLHA